VGEIAIACDVAPVILPLLSTENTPILAALPYVNATTPVVVNTGFGYDSIKSPPAAPVGMRELLNLASFH
jgi:hypothetical protein